MCRNTIIHIHRYSAIQFKWKEKIILSYKTIIELGGKCKQLKYSVPVSRNLNSGAFHFRRRRRGSTAAHRRGSGHCRYSE